jgi:hypothetical protein
MAIMIREVMNAWRIHSVLRCSSPSTASRNRSAEAATVAKSTHAGILWLRFIRQQLDPRVHFWPFDGWDIPQGKSAIAEVYPALWRHAYPHADRTGDRHDAYSITAWLSQANRDGSLAGFLQPELAPQARVIAQVEG